MESLLCRESDGCVLFALKHTLPRGIVRGERARAWTLLSDDDRRAAVLGGFAAAFGDAALSPTEYFEHDWPFEQWSRGGSGVLLDYGSTIREPGCPIHGAGTEASTFWNGCMEGVVCSGERAALEILAFGCAKSLVVSKATTRVKESA